MSAAEPRPAAVAEPVLLLTCLTCRQDREHPPGEPLRGECPTCGDWALTARLRTPGGVA